MAKTEKKAAGEPVPPEASSSKSGLGRTATIIASAAVVAAVVAGSLYYRASNAPVDPEAPKTDPNVSELMMKGPLDEMSIGKADAPNTIVEYASMTCSHCAHFATEVFPELKTKYIDTGQVRFILREFPLDGLAVAAFMLARCAGPDRYFPMVDGLFETQKSWAVPGADGKEKLLTIAKQAGFSKERFDECVGDKALFDKIVEVRQRAHDKFGVDSTPTFFVNGKRLRGGQDIKEFDEALSGKAPAEGTTPPSG